MGVAEDDVAGVDLKPVERLGEGQQRGPPQLGDGELGPQRADPGAVQRPDRRGEPGAQRAAAKRGGLERAGKRHRAAAASARAAPRTERLPGPGRGAVRAPSERRAAGLRNGVDPGVDRRLEPLVVLDAPRTVGERADRPGHHPGGEPLEHRHRRVDVEQVAVEGVDVLAQPHPGVAHPHPRRGERAGQGAEPLVVADVDVGGCAQARGAGVAALGERIEQMVVVIARDDHHLAVGTERLRQLAERRRRGVERRRSRPLTELDDVAEQDEPADPGEGRHEAGPHTGVGPQQVAAGRHPQMEVGDDERRRHGGAGWGPTGHGDRAARVRRRERRRPSPGGCASAA